MREHVQMQQETKITVGGTEVNLNRIWTIPNILSMFRLALIPVIVWLYCVEMEYRWAAVILILSGLTDMADGFIARRFHMSSNLGKALDPIADKLTQFVVLICLVTKFPKMLLPVCLLPVKELTTGILSFLVIQRTGKVDGADWHGKVATALLDATMVLHVLWIEITEWFSTVSIIACTVMILVSFALYTVRHLRILTSAKAQSDTTKV